MIREGFALTSLPITQLQPEDIMVSSDVVEWNGSLSQLERRTTLNFRPHFGWKFRVDSKFPASLRLDWAY